MSYEELLRAFKQRAMKAGAQTVSGEFISIEGRPSSLPQAVSNEPEPLLIDTSIKNLIGTGRL